MNKREFTAMALAGAFATALGSLTFAATASAQDNEMCYGIAKAGENDCKAGAHDCAGMSTVDYDPKSFKLVAKGTCKTMDVEGHMGTLEPMDS